MAGIDGSCWLECVSLGKHQRDTNGCRVRPDEGLDAIASLSPGSLGSDLLVGGTNTVYAWLIQWLAENLGEIYCVQVMYLLYFIMALIIAHQDTMYLR